MSLYRSKERLADRLFNSIRWIFISSALFTSCTYADNTIDEYANAINQEYWSIQLENDVLAKSGDRYYTHGTQVSRLVMNKPPSWLQNIASFFPAFESDGTISGVNYTIGQKIFTPDDIKTTELVVDDRPYAGYLYFSAALLSRVSNQNNVDTGNLLEFTAGIVGPSALAEDVQTSIHDLTDSNDPNGWDHQLSDEPGLGLSYSRFWRQIKPLTSSLEYAISPHVNVAIGNVYTHLASGAMFRFGSHLANDLAPPNISPGFPGVSFFRSNGQNNWYLFAGIEARAVARDIFLDGNTFRDSHSVDKKPLVGDFQFGFVFQTGNLRLSVSQMIRSKEFEGQQDKTNFGAINISFSI
ncbi:MAG: lipid A deacylase LpxR family protein [Gammaproteobacteria bacterium]|nr:lipid A deacylase LpxR family protein [Gammaproteobacteria bacterium]